LFIFRQKATSPGAVNELSLMNEYSVLFTNSAYRPSGPRDRRNKTYFSQWERT